MSIRAFRTQNSIKNVHYAEINYFGEKNDFVDDKYELSTNYGCSNY